MLNRIGSAFLLVGALVMLAACANPAATASGSDNTKTSRVTGIDTSGGGGGGGGGY